MAAINFNEIFSNLKSGVEQLAKDNVNQFSKEATQDGLQFLNSSKKNLEKWTYQVANGEMDKDDLTFLINGQRDLMEMAALQKKGLAKIQIDKFKDGLCGICIRTIFGIK